MTKQEMLKALQEGKKVRHRYFSDDEWMMRRADGNYMFEDGVSCSAGLFWADRSGEQYNADWEIVN